MRRASVLVASLALLACSRGERKDPALDSSAIAAEQLSLQVGDSTAQAREMKAGVIDRDRHEEYGAVSSCADSSVDEGGWVRNDLDPMPVRITLPPDFHHMVDRSLIARPDSVQVWLGNDNSRLNFVRTSTNYVVNDSSGHVSKYECEVVISGMRTHFHADRQPGTNMKSVHAAYRLDGGGLLMVSGDIHGAARQSAIVHALYSLNVTR
ncbi:MAG: hypothetical protein JWO05_1350 [Gemmatimonadetes bacterium]|nr:hypothetical protein [Gemmatimonadota bacterium]